MHSSLDNKLFKKLSILKIKLFIEPTHAWTEHDVSIGIDLYVINLVFGPTGNGENSQPQDDTLQLLHDAGLTISLANR